MIAKLTPFATRTIELTFLVPLPHGSMQELDGVLAEHGFPGPRDASNPAEVARDRNSVME